MDEMFPAFYSQRASTVIEGFLEKRGVWNPSWRRRYFVLESCGRLSYYKHKPDSTIPGRALGGIPICVQTAIVPAHPATKTAHGSRAILEVRMPGGGVSSGRTFLLSAPSCEEGERWAAALAEVRRRVLYVSFPLSARHW